MVKKYTHLRSILYIWLFEVYFSVFKTEQIRSTREVQILKLRSEWNELLLNKSKRIQFFETKFKDLYDERFFGTLLNKTNLIIDAVNDRLPLTQLEEVRCKFIVKSYTFQKFLIININLTHNNQCITTIKKFNNN